MPTAQRYGLSSKCQLGSSLAGAGRVEGDALNNVGALIKIGRGSALLSVISLVSFTVCWGVSPFSCAKAPATNNSIKAKAAKKVVMMLVLVRFFNLFLLFEMSSHRLSKLASV